jgi:hypothetical protein
VESHGQGVVIMLPIFPRYVEFGVGCTCNKLPDPFVDFFEALTSKGPSADLMAHCRRELMHAVWRLLLDAEFLQAYMQCFDGVLRPFFPRIFTYSANYPEKYVVQLVTSL